MEPDLSMKPCPFCNYPPDGQIGHADDCWMMIHHDLSIPLEEVKKAWNRRAEADELEAKINLLYQTQNGIIRKWNMWEAYARELVVALKGVAPNWDNPSGYCYCSQDAFHDDDGERIEHDGDHELQCARARKALYRAAEGNTL